jgi:hypothetical protein
LIVEESPSKKAGGILVTVFALVVHRAFVVRLAFCTFRRAEEISSWTTCVLVDFGF